jgi:hypothetical protein
MARKTMTTHEMEAFLGVKKSGISQVRKHLVDFPKPAGKVGITHFYYKYQISAYAKKYDIHAELKKAWRLAAKEWQDKAEAKAARPVITPVSLLFDSVKSKKRKRPQSAVMPYRQRVEVNYPDWQAY